MKLNFSTLLIFICSLNLSFASANPPDAAEGEKIVKTVCLACHGIDGIATNPLWPNVRGQNYDYLVKQINEFRSGIRANPLMTPISQTLKDDDIANVAKYYSSLKN